MNTEGPLPRPNAEARDARPALLAAIAAAMALIIALGLAGARLQLGAPTPASEAMLRGADQLFQHGVLARTDIERAWDEMPAPAKSGDKYGWVDRRAGIVRIPIERAIDLMCAGGDGAKHGGQGEK